jgi:hypothetical protein
MTQDLTHREAWDLIPWVVNGTAAPAECACVERHLAECADCRDEFAFQGLLHAGMRQPRSDDVRPAAPAFERLLARLDGESAPASAPGAARIAHRGRRRRGVRSRQVLAALLVAQTLALTLIGVVLLARAWGPQAPAYRTLSSAPAAPGQATIRLVAAPTLSLGGLQRLLADAGAVIVETNRDGSILGLAPATPAERDASRAQNAAILARLRADPRVLLAEPVVAAAVHAR